MFKALAVLASLALSAPAYAFTICAGETYTGIIVKVEINTVGSMGYPQDGSVAITQKDGSTQRYTLKNTEIVQFFETTDYKTAIVGLAAYQDMNNPISIRYVGKHIEEDVITVLRDTNRKKQPGNEMRVWKGPGFGPNEQFQFTDVICTVGLDA